MADILTAPFMREMINTCANMYRLGWNERNGGNISLLLDEVEVEAYLELGNPLREFDIGFDAGALLGRLFLVTGTGKYFKNVETDPADGLGIIRVVGDGTKAALLWGYAGGGRPTSELFAHLMSHIERLKIDPQHRVIMHTHSTNTLAMTYVHDLDERVFTRTLWRMSTESIVVFPDGVGVLPWMLCGTDEIGRATAEKMKRFRLCVWAAHGIFGTGRDLDETFGLIETVEKAATIYVKVMNSRVLNTITDAQLKLLAQAYGVQYPEGYLE
jgi:rhamnulose-1-phosphate aldolase